MMWLIEALKEWWYVNIKRGKVHYVSGWEIRKKEI